RPALQPPRRGPPTVHHRRRRTAHRAARTAHETDRPHRNPGESGLVRATDARRALHPLDRRGPRRHRLPGPRHGRRGRQAQPPYLNPEALPGLRRAARVRTKETPCHHLHRLPDRARRDQVPCGWLTLRSLRSPRAARHARSATRSGTGGWSTTGRRGDRFGSIFTPPHRSTSGSVQRRRGEAGQLLQRRPCHPLVHALQDEGVKVGAAVLQPLIGGADGTGLLGEAVGQVHVFLRWLGVVREVVGDGAVTVGAVLGGDEFVDDQLHGLAAGEGGDRGDEVVPCGLVVLAVLGVTVDGAVGEDAYVVGVVEVGVFGALGHGDSVL